jgi:hypothetical protein
MNGAVAARSPFFWFVSQAAAIVAYLLLWLATAWGVTILCRRTVMKGLLSQRGMRYRQEIVWRILSREKLSRSTAQRRLAPARSAWLGVLPMQRRRKAACCIGESGA